MFRVIHPNRWFFWTVALLLGVGLFVIWSVQKAGLRFYDQPIATDTKVWRTWNSDPLGISVRYPAGWQIEIDLEDAHNVYLENSQNYHENISIAVRDPGLEAAIRLSLNISSEELVTVGGEPGRWLKGENEDDQVTSNVILVNHKDQLYYIAGSGRSFENIISGIKFVSK